MTEDSAQKFRRMRKWVATGQILTQALPNILRYDDAKIVVKYGGHAMGNAKLTNIFAQDIVMLKQVGLKPIVVHGGGPQIGEMLDRLKIESSFVQGLRVTDSATVDIVEMVLAGSINKRIVAGINRAGGKAVGLSGKDGGLIKAHKIHRTTRDPESNIERLLDLGFVGEPETVNPHILDIITASELIPVVAPIGQGPDGETFNINADTAAGAIAGAVGADRMLLLTDVAGVMDKSGKLIDTLTARQAKKLLAEGTIKGGMIPKVETALAAVAQGVGGVVIMDGRVPHGMLLELFTEEGAGTLIQKM